MGACHGFHAVIQVFVFISNPCKKGTSGGITLATHKSAAKRARQSKRRQNVNQRNTSMVKTFERKLREAVGNKKVDEAQKVLQEYMSKMMKAANKGVFHYKTASRKISRLSSLVSDLGK